MESINRIRLSVVGFFGNKFVKKGMPYFVFMLVGAAGLREFASLRYEFRRVGEVEIEEIKKSGIEMTHRTLEEEYERTIKTIDVDNWSNVRLPRPWDETVE